MKACRFVDLFCAAVLLVCVDAVAIGQGQPALTPQTYAQLKYRYIGPAGNRTIAVAGLPGNPWVYYVGAASGGIFKTTDGGARWTPIFDDQPVASIGSLAVAASDPNTVWAGTGEAFIRSNISIGNGVYKSTDAGKTWTHMGLDRTGRIGRIVIDPRNPDVVFAAAMGHSYGPQPERGLFRTIDGGKTWQRVLFVDENTGCSDVAIDPNNARILFAGMWQLEIHTWGRTSGGPGSGLYISRDGGSTWQKLTGHGLPKDPIGKVALAVAKTNSNRVYALIETADGVSWDGQPVESGELWRSDDGGENWKVVSHDRQLAGRTHYYSRHAVAPDNENEVYFLTASFTKTLDGGETSIDVPQRDSPAGDHHDIWIDPTDGNRMIVSHDGGLSITTNRGRSWQRVQLPVAQMYHVAVDNAVPYNVYGNMQDGPSTRGPSISRATVFGGENEAGLIYRGLWHGVAGGESGFAMPDKNDPNIIWSTASGFGSVGGIVERFDLRTMQARRVEVWPRYTVGSPAADLKYRFQWTFPLAISPHDGRVYAGSQYVHQTTDNGQSWQVISPDLTLNDKTHQQRSGGLTPDNVGVEYSGVLFAIAESSIEKGLIWAGSNDGLLHVTRDGGAHWTNVTASLPSLPPLGTVSNVEPSRHDAGTAYVTYDLHQVNNRDPFVFKTTDYGKTWKSIASDLPKGMATYAHCVREDPVRRGLLFLGTESALYVSFNDGQSWLPLQNGLPHAPVHWLTIQENFNDLVVATYGRGFYILDDITPLRQLTPQVLSADAHLFTPRAAYRFQATSEPGAVNDDPTEGRNPPYGASIAYFLKSAATSDVKVTILNARGETVRALTGSKDAGLNRVWWDLRYERTPEVRLRTPPMFAPETRLNKDGWRPLASGGRLGVLAPPGTYTVKLSAGGKDLTQPLTIRKDPNTSGSEADIEAQTKIMFEIRDATTQVADGINRAERVRAQLASLKTMMSDDETGKAVKEASDALDKKIIAVEETLHQMRLTGRGQDLIRYPGQLIDHLLYLANGLALSDFPPTTQQLEAHAELKKETSERSAQMNEVLTKDLATFNRLLIDRSVPHVIGVNPTSASSEDPKEK
jgi:photosystem II stability/assembly factor-like uncharacterized protein